MSRIVVSARVVLARLRRIGSRIAVAVALALAVASSVSGQTGATPTGTVILDPTLLHPPAGTRVAIVEFEDMQCPVCASTNPILKQAVEQYKIPWVRRELLIPSHNWSLYAAINARWFDARSKALGDDYRNQVFASQRSITDPGALMQFTMSFARSHKIDLPDVIDPQGVIAAQVKADSALNLRAGIQHTPTVFVVTSGGKGAAYVEIEPPSTDRLSAAIEKALADTASTARTADNKKSTAR